MTLQLKQEVVEFRDGSKITLSESDWPMSMRLSELENEISLRSFDDPKNQLFAVVFYPKMAACVTSEPVPGLDEVLPTNGNTGWPLTELNKWYEAARRVNPDWFAGLDQIGEAAPKSEEEIKKKTRRNRKNNSASK
jgi:hypothetical protein